MGAGPRQNPHLRADWPRAKMKATNVRIDAAHHRKRRSPNASASTIPKMPKPKTLGPIGPLVPEPYQIDTRGVPKRTFSRTSGQNLGTVKLSIPKRKAPAPDTNSITAKNAKMPNFRRRSRPVAPAISPSDAAVRAGAHKTDI